MAWGLIHAHAAGLPVRGADSHAMPYRVRDKEDDLSKGGERMLHRERVSSPGDRL